MPTFQTPDPITAIVDVPVGTVHVIASDRSDTVVEVRPADPSDKNDVRAAKQVRVEFGAGRLSVTTPKSWRPFGPFSGTPSIEVTIEVPTGTRLKGGVALGRLLATGEFADCELEVASGDIAVERPAGPVTATTAKGDISVSEAARGILRLQTHMGDLQVGIRAGSAARLETSALHGHVQNRIDPAAAQPGTEDLVQVYARNSYGNIIIGHTAAA
ncbi:hypothetical protein JK358_14035 [Nocardia sp. 2]|uniref:DUF4097 domain-containing protein n=1 Tax=Nocardia acididurans TaxID=2802282 RepID=A0ABS1M4J8_9NOCA|nr:DUF4097 family beta strand repeat-containing protein [Nocardia acididurans]MBL1075515.1 hypothetical protein [Nocardia acididurans]